MSAVPRTDGAPLRVLQVVGNSVIGGAESHVLTLARALDPARYRVAVVCPRPGPLVEALQADRVAVHLIDMVRPAPNDEYELSLPALGTLHSLVRRWRPDLVHSHLYPAHLHASLAGELAGQAALVTTAHTLVVRPGDAWLARMTACRVIAVSQAAKARLVENGVPARRVRVIYNGIEPRYFENEAESASRLRQQLGIAAAAPVVGIIARLSPEKGHDAFLTIARDIVVRRPDSRFLIVGTGPTAAALEAQSAALGLEEHVVFTGARRDVTALNHVIDIFLLPSREEALPLALLEAMAAGRPVVASAVGGVPEVVVDGETGFLCQPEDHASFLRAVETLLAQQDLRERLGIAGRQRVRRSFGVHQMIGETVRFYRTILGRDARP